MITPFHLLPLLFLISALFVQTHAHGFMKTPRTRGSYKSQKVQPDIPVPAGAPTDFCPHCQNGGGVGSVKLALNNNFTPYRSDNRARAGLCGDPVGGTAHMIGGEFVPFKTAPIVEKYAPGQVADFSVQIDTNHNGFFVFYLCNLDACGTKDIDQKCFENNHCSLLKRVASPACENSSDNFECGPIDQDHPERWYVPCRGGPSNVKGGNKGSMKYKIPEDVQCKHCVVQWYWVTANSCNPKGMKEYFSAKSPFGNSCGGDGGSVGGINPSMVECGGAKFAEEFWGCADVSVGSGAALDKSLPPDSQNDDPEVVASASTESSVTKTPSPSPTPSPVAEIEDPEPELVQPEALTAEEPTAPKLDPTQTPTPSPSPSPSPTLTPSPETIAEDSQAQLMQASDNQQPETIADPVEPQQPETKKAQDSTMNEVESVPTNQGMKIDNNEKSSEPTKESNNGIMHKKFKSRRRRRKIRRHFRRKHAYWYYHW